MLTMRGLIEEAVRRGIAEVKTVGYSPHKERGAIAGFRRCLKLGSLEQFQAELERCEAEEHRLRDNLMEARSESDSDESSVREAYWEQRTFTLQIEHTYKLLCAAYHVNKLPGYDRLPAPYASGIRLYAMIAGVSGMNIGDVESFFNGGG